MGCELSVAVGEDFDRLLYYSTPGSILRFMTASICLAAAWTRVRGSEPIIEQEQKATQMGMSLRRIQCWICRDLEMLFNTT